MKKAIGIFMSLVLCSISEGQNVSLQNVIPLSPEAATFTKYGAYSASPFTGRPDIEAPIYEIKTRNFSIPISISYDATGIRVDDISSWVGMNWSLNVGGMVSRIVMCVPDEGPYGFLTAPPPRVYEISNTSTYIDYFKNLLIEAPSSTNVHDTDPDRFFYSFNGRSGSFVFKRDQSIMQIPQTSLKIYFESLGSQDRFKIIDENGTKYLFDSLEVTNVYSTSEWNGTSNSKYINSGWALTEIISNDGTEHVYFNYEREATGTHRTNDFRETYGQEWDGSAFVNQQKKYWSGMERTMSSPRLKSIVFTGGKVTFTRVQDRLDDYGSRLDEISIYSCIDTSSYTKLKSFKFKQGYYYSSGTYTNNATYSFSPVTRDRYRLRLDTLELRDALGSKISDYQFIYDTAIMLPPKTSCSQDWWGYSNGTSNQTLVPSATTWTGVSIGGANRNPDSAYMKSGTLKKIVYPTKGYTEFETEPHKFSTIKDLTTTMTYGATVYGYEGATHTQTISFTTPSSNGFGGNGRVNVFITPYPTSGLPSYNDPNVQQYASLAPQVKIKNLSNNQVTTYTSPDNTNYYSSEISYSFAASTSYEITILCYTNYNGVMVNGTAKFDSTSQQVQTFLAGGLRLKRIKNYSSNNVMANQETYVYGVNRDGVGEYAGVTFFSNTLFESKHVVSGVYGTVQVDKMNYLSGFVHDQTPLQGSPVVYRLTTKYLGTPTNNSGKTAYYYGDEPFIETSPLPSGMEIANNMGFLIRDNHWRKGNLIWQQDYKRINDSTYTPVRKEINTYNTPIRDTSFGLYSKAKTYRPTGATYSLSDFAYAEYAINTGFVQLTQTLTKEYASTGTDSLESVKTYVYDSTHGDFALKTTNINSKGDTVEISKKYPFNKSAFSSSGSVTSAESIAIDSLIVRNIISQPLEEIEKIAGVQTNRVRHQYEFVNSNKIAPISVKGQRGSNALETLLLFPKYDAYGNLKEQQKISDAVTSYIWDYYSVFPIAQVSNASDTSIAYTSFEADGKGNWSFSGSVTSDSTAPTGSKCYNTSGGNITRSSLPNSTYIVSYWGKTGNVTVNGGSPTGTGKTIGSWTYYEHEITGTSVTISGSKYIDELRLYPKGAQMTTYTYTPLLGITSKCDIANRITYFSYDTWARLKFMKDEDRNIIKKTDYQYQATIQQ